MLYIHETADKVDFYPDASIYCVTLTGDYIIKRNIVDNLARQSFICCFPELSLRVETSLENRSAFLFAPTINHNVLTFDDVDKILKGIKKVHFNKCNKRLRLHYCNNTILILSDLRKNSYVFDDSEIKFNQILSDFVDKEQEKWLKCEPVKVPDYAIINILIELAFNQDLKEARNADH